MNIIRIGLLKRYQIYFSRSESSAIIENKELNKIFYYNEKN